MKGKSGITSSSILALVFVLALGLGLSLACQAQSPAPTVAATAAAKPAAPAPQATPQPAAAPVQTAAATAAAQPAAPSPQPTAIAAGTVKIGIVFGITGPAAALGISLTRWIQLAIDDINAKGGVQAGGKRYQLEGLVVDDKNTADGGRETANKLVLADKVRFILGPGGNSVSGMQPLTEPNKVLILGATLTDKSAGPDFPFSFAVNPHHSTRSIALFDWLSQEHPEVKRIAIVNYDDISGRDQANAVEAAAKTRGFTIVAKEFVPLDMKDAGPLVTRVLRSNPDAIYNESSNRVALWLLIQQALSDQGFKGPRFGGSVDAGAVSKGYKYLEGFTGVSMLDYKSTVVGSQIQELIQRFWQKYGQEDAAVSTYLLYNTALVLAQAMEKAGTVDDTALIAKTLQDGQWDTVWSPQLGKSGFGGTKTFGRRAVLDHALYLSKQEDGKPATFRVTKASVP